MLVLDVSINRIFHIGEIHILRIGGSKGEECEYKIVTPEGYEKTFKHDYKKGWFDLVAEIIAYLKERGYSTPV